VPPFGEKRWVVTDAAGRQWALSCGGGDGARPSTAFDGVTARLINAAFTPWGIRDRWLAKTLLAVHAALTGERARLTENDRNAGDWAHRVRELRESFRRKTWTGRLRVEPVTALRVPFEEQPPDTVRNVVAPVVEDDSTFELLVVDEAGEPIGGIALCQRSCRLRRVAA